MIEFEMKATVDSNINQVELHHVITYILLNGIEGFSIKEMSFKEVEADTGIQRKALMPNKQQNDDEFVGEINIEMK